MPGDETGGVDNFYFSFDYGLVHSVSLCSEDYAYPWEAGSAQYNWARAVRQCVACVISHADLFLKTIKDLQKAVANRHNVPWIIVSFHRPFYGTTSSGSWEGIRQGIFLFFFFEKSLILYLCAFIALPSLRAAPERVQRRHLLCGPHPRI